MCDAVIGVLAGVVLMAVALMVFQAVKAAVQDSYPQFAGVCLVAVATVLVVAYPVVMGLVILAALCVAAVVLLIGAGSDAYRTGAFFGGYFCFELAGECIKVLCLVLVAIVQAVADAKG